LPENAPIVSLGEGNTPLVWIDAFERKIGFKLEFLNPTGSFKDRGTAPMVSFLCTRGITSAVEDSSGNAGASFAAYAGVFGIQARVFVPAHASGPKRKQIEAYGAEIVSVPGPRAKAAEAVELAAEEGKVYASHVYMPHGLSGYATVAYELFEQMDGAIGTVITPAGQGSLLMGMWRGFMALQSAGLLLNLPVMIGVQAAACPPLWAAFNKDEMAFDQIFEQETLAEGVRSQDPLRGEELIQLVRSSQGYFVIVHEEDILPGRNQLAHRGLFVEPTSAIIWDGISQIVGQVPEPIVAILTGSGLKSNQ
jgi:threonine synthase